MPDSRISFLWRDAGAAIGYETGVSLHSHTSASKEPLEFIPRYLNRAPFGRELATLRSLPAPLSEAYWTPPLAPRAALTLERQQIETKLGLRPLVSLTDHDSLDAPLRLRLLPEAPPLSVEWTVPFGPTFFHLGLHHLPAQNPSVLMAELAAFTRQPSGERLRELLRWLCESEDVLVVFNHPLWDEKGIGQDQHNAVVELFLNSNREFIHALELNGLRPWTENRAVTHLADRWNLPVIAGGDRHGSEPNANVNLTRAKTFAEFVGEVRQDRHSHVLFMPQYREPYALRVMQTIVDVLRDYPEFPEGARRWDDRVFYPASDGIDRPVSYYWPDRSPWLVKRFIGLVRILQNQRVQSALRFALQEGPPALP